MVGGTADDACALDEHAAAIRSRRHGIVGVVVIVAALAATAMAYLNPTDQNGYTAHLSNSGGVRVGDQVRIAGIPVGKVTGVRLDGAVVEMKFDVKRSVVVGSESTLDVKLLTPLGGHYVALDPKGGIPLGRNVIPPQRVTLPFEVNDIIQAATPLIKEVNGQVIHDTFTEVANAANKYPDAIRDLLRSANALTTSLSKSTSDFHRSLDFVNNGLRAVVAGRKQLVTLLEQIDILDHGVHLEDGRYRRILRPAQRIDSNHGPHHGVLRPGGRADRQRARRHHRHAGRPPRPYRLRRSMAWGRPSTS